MQLRSELRIQPLTCSFAEDCFDCCSRFKSKRGPRKDSQELLTRYRIGWYGQSRRILRMVPFSRSRRNSSCSDSVSAQSSSWPISPNGLDYHDSFEFEFRQARSVQHPVTHLRIPRLTNGDDIRILTVDPPRIFLEALRALQHKDTAASRSTGRSHSTGWTSLLMFARAIDAWNSDIVSLALPPPLSVSKAHQDLSSLFQGNESLDLLRFLKAHNERESRIPNEERQACKTFIPYFSAVIHSLFTLHHYSTDDCRLKIDHLNPSLLDTKEARSSFPGVPYQSSPCSQQTRP